MEKVVRICGYAKGICVESNDPTLVSLLRSRIEGIKIHDGEPHLTNPDIFPKLRRACTILKRRGWKVRLDKNLRFEGCVQAIEAYLREEISAKTAIPWIEAFERAARMPWIGVANKLRASQIMAGLCRHQDRGGSIGGYVILRLDRYQGLVDSLSLKDTQIQRIMAENGKLNLDLRAWKEGKMESV